MVAGSKATELRMGQLAIALTIECIAGPQHRLVQQFQIVDRHDLLALGITVREHTPGNQVSRSSEIEDDTAVGDDAVEVLRVYAAPK